MKYLDYVLLVLVLCFHCDALSPCEQEVTIELGLEAKSVYHYKEPTYERFLLCEWRFLAHNPDRQIVYQFTNISVDCGDTLTAFTNETEYTAPPICGIGKNSETETTPAGELKLVLNSDKNVHEHEKGFTLHMIAAKGNEVCPQQPINVTSVKQQIASPNFPNFYAANLQCRFILTAPTGVELTFEYIDIEKHTDCTPNSCCDELIIYEGLAGENKKLASICGTDMFHPNLTYESVGRTLTLELRTDNQSPRKGFVATVQAKKGDPIPIITQSTIATTEKILTPPVLATTEAVIYTPETTESSIETLEAWSYGTFELRCFIPTLERGVDISWTKDGYPFGPARDSTRYYFMEDDTLVTFTSIFKEDAGIYTCKANEPFYPTYTARVVVRDKDVNECEQNVCPVNSICINTIPSYRCECHEGWEGQQCDIDINECEIRPSLCLPNGKCLNLDGNYTCNCNQGWTGDNCLTDINECEADPHPCAPNGKCVNSNGDFTCECNNGWTGANCLTDVNECQVQPKLCAPNGNCVNKNGSYECRCKPGWTGDNCQKDINECETLLNPCSGHGRCVNSRGNYSCSCYKGWEGGRCEKGVNKCELQPKLCAPNGECVNVNGSHICKCKIGWTGDDCRTDVNECKGLPKDSRCWPNGRCVNQDGGYYCECNEGWTGRKCQSDVNECNTLPRPCSGHGTCVNSVGSYFCTCYKDWEGKKCEKRIDPCLADPCPKNSICKMKGNSFECVCKTGWEGPQCEKEVQKATGACATKCRGTESCYIGHNCTHYEHCYAWNGAECHCTLMVCSFGTFWNSKINNCDMVAQVDCKSDPCLHSKYGTTYPSYFNCRTFYTCNRHQHSLPMCCNKGYAYNHQAQKCTPNPYCNVECAEREITQTTVSPVTTTISMGTCYFRPVARRPTKYLNLISNIIQDCPLGTIFEEDYCVCVQDLSFSRGKCVPIVNVDFHGDHIINLSHESYLQLNNVQQVDSGIANVSYGWFNGQSSSIQIPRLNAVALPRLKIQLRFYASMPSNSRYQVLVSNCRSSAKPWNILDVAQDQSPSLAIIANTLDQHLTFLGYSDDWKVTPVTFHLPYKAGAWNNVELAFNGSSLKGRVRSVNEDQSAFETVEEMPFSGRIAAPTGPLVIGRCSDKDAFYGYIDMVKVFECVTSL
eukprot:XP_011445343.1 PREDICTED: uncharacterized protein LOC105340823 [Crassostrea gigas]